MHTASVRFATAMNNDNDKNNNSKGVSVCKCLCGSIDFWLLGQPAIQPEVNCVGNFFVSTIAPNFQKSTEFWSSKNPHFNAKTNVNGKETDESDRARERKRKKMRWFYRHHGFSIFSGLRKHIYTQSTQVHMHFHFTYLICVSCMYTEPKASEVTTCFQFANCYCIEK